MNSLFQYEMSLNLICRVGHYERQMINMEEAKLQTLVQVKAFLDGTSEVAFRIPKEGKRMQGIPLQEHDDTL